MSTVIFSMFVFLLSGSLKSAEIALQKEPIDLIISAMRQDRNSFMQYFQAPGDQEVEAMEQNSILNSLLFANMQELPNERERRRFSESYNPYMRVGERNLAACIFKYSLNKIDSQTWITSIYNKGIYSSFPALRAAFILLYPEAPPTEEVIFKENAFFVRNFELFNLFFAYLSDNEQVMVERYRQYLRVVFTTGWDKYESVGNYLE